MPLRVVGVDGIDAGEPCGLDVGEVAGKSPDRNRGEWERIHPGRVRLRADKSLAGQGARLAAQKNVGTPVDLLQTGQQFFAGQSIWIAFFLVAGFSRKLGTCSL